MLSDSERAGAAEWGKLLESPLTYFEVMRIKMAHAALCRWAVAAYGKAHAKWCGKECALTNL